ncbi:MAG: cytochrome-c oxidase, cbb3-type subunit III [Novosphingobium sp.]|nr:cytochrome-c oxidase, cbb3-type subunit III [Novosphingobium sp.]
MTDKKHDPRIDEATGVETVGHEWDGIEELNNPLPRWWLWSFYATILFALGYVVAYPAIPLAHRASAGVLGWTSRGQLAGETALVARERAPLMARLAATPIERLEADPELMRAAVTGGRAAFRANCVACHGAGAAGVVGHYPNLNDDDWLWGGNLKQIEYTITHGIRQPGHDQTRTSQMPSFGRDGILAPAQVQDVASFVRTLSRLERPSASSARGRELFAANCVACHGTEGNGNRQLGAPNLTDAIWLYGGSRDAIVNSVTNAHAGVMPAWGGTLDLATIKMLAAYVHSLGGGEGFTAPQPAPSGAIADARP